MRDDAFVYTPGAEVPRDVARLRVHGAVAVLPADVFYDLRQLREVDLPEGLAEIRGGAVNGCVSLGRLRLPSTIAAVGALAFYSCTSLREIEAREGLVEIGVNAFGVCSSLERVRLPSTLSTISEEAFFHCTSLRHVSLDGIRAIGYRAFEHCKSLKDILLPANLTTIGSRAFRCCISLEAVKLSGGIQLIGDEVFDQCNCLAGITIPFGALVVTEAESDHHFSFVANGIIPLSNRKQVVIASDCFRSMAPSQASEVKRAVAGILGTQMQAGWDDKREHLRAWLAPHEARHRKEVATLLELGLWKTGMEPWEDASSPEFRADCRIACKAGVVVPNVMSFL